MPDDALRRLHEVCPLAALSSHGLGPLADWMPSATGAEELARNPTFQRIALETLGATAHAVLRVVNFWGGLVTADRWALETAEADPEELATALDRLTTLGLALVDEHGTVSGTLLGPEWFENVAFSYDDQNAVTTDELADMLRRWGLDVPGRKGERAASLRHLFATTHPDLIFSGLDPGARPLFERIADTAGVFVIEPEEVGVDGFQLHLMAAARYRRPNEAFSSRIDRAFADLVEAGLVGFDANQRLLWIWNEAWPLTGRPVVRSWPRVAAPALVARPVLPPRVGELATVLDRALAHWNEHPPKVLKNNEPRFPKADLRSAARQLGVGETVLDLAARFLVAIEVFLPNVVSTSGRGRNRKVDEVWLVDPDVAAAWAGLALVDQWLFLVERWLGLGGPERLAAARQLVLYELLALPLESAWADRRSSSEWLAHRYAPLVDAGEVLEMFDEMAALGLIEPDVVALTTLGRLAVLDPRAARDADLGDVGTFIVQPDFSIVAPPDLAPDVVSELVTFATLESSAGAHIYRLDESLITRAVQRGADPDDIVGFLAAHSTVPVPEVVARFVTDAARRADRFALHAAATVLVTTDPVDLADAVAVKAAKLVRVGDTLALSTLPPDKVRAALGRRRIEAHVVGAADDRPVAKRSSDHADVVAARAAQLAEHAERSGHEYFRAHAEQLSRQAERLRNPSSRFRLSARPLAFDPALLGEHPPDPTA